MNKKSFKYFLILVLCVAIFPLAFVFAPSYTASAISNSCTASFSENVLTSISGDFTGLRAESLDDVYEILDEFKNDFGFSSSRQALLFDKTVDSLIGKVYRFKQMINGIEVYGSDVIVSVKNNYRVTSITGKYYLDVKYDESLSYSKAEALETVKNNYPEMDVEFSKEYIYDFENDGYVAYVFDASSIGESHKVFISAKTGEIVEDKKTDTLLRKDLDSTGYKTTTEKHVYTIDGETFSVDVTKYTSILNPSSYFYALSNPSKNISMANGQNKSNYSCLYYDDETGTLNFNDDDAIKAYYSLLRCYDFYADKSNFGFEQKGIKNKSGATINLVAIVHFGTNYENAGYSGPSGNGTKGYFIFGDGNSSSLTSPTYSFVNGIDIVGHEYQHAFTTQICDFDYEGESGALAEAFSDIFGAVIEGKGIANEGFWQMGEDVVKYSRNIFRDMSNPTLHGCVADYTSFKNNISRCGGNYTEDNDYGAIHYNCTLPTYATYLMYKQNPEFFTEYNILRLWYQTLTKLGTKAGIADFCSAMVEAANDLEFSSENKMIINSVFATIGVPGYTGIEIWNGLSCSVLQGDGSIANPYLVNSLQDLASVAYYVNNGDAKYQTARYRLTSDITISSNIDWEAIGTDAKKFDGYFNGGSNTITIDINIPSNGKSNFSGIFGVCGSKAYIYDLNVKGTDIDTKSDSAGAIALKLGGTLSGCSSSLNISGNIVGGLVGYFTNNDGGQKIVNCFATSTLSGDYVGGLVGWFDTVKNTSLGIYQSGTISSSYFSGKIKAISAGGGLASVAYGIHFINNIVNATIDLQSSSNTAGGGLVGYLDFEAGDEKVMVTGVQNYLLNNKVIINFENDLKHYRAGLLVGVVEGSAGEGISYFENNVVKDDSVHKAYNSIADASTIIENNTILSTDNAFSGDFDFDNKNYYKSDNWFLIQGTTAFDMDSTFKVVANSMPVFKEVEFWLDDVAYNFKGSGTAADPYQIATAKQLAGLSAIMTGGYYSNYADKNYILTADIDLSGKVWAGIGTVIYTYQNNVLSRVTYRGFKGSFNGNGYTISNMTTLGLYSISKGSANGTYSLYEFNPALFSVTTTTDSSSALLALTTVNSAPSISNLTIENVVSTGNNASSVVSKVFGEITISSVTAMNVKISSSGVAGGFIGKIAGNGKSYTNSILSSTIENSYVLGTVSGLIVGGAVGYITNVSSSTKASVEISNFLLRGSLVVLGDDHEAEYDSENESASYYMPIAGSIVGVTFAKNLDIVNCISLADIVSYTAGASLGGFIGGVGVGDQFACTGMTIKVDGSKQVGNIYDVFNKTSAFSGSVLGITHSNLASSLTLTVTNTTYTNVNSSVIYRNNMTSVVVNSEIKFSSDEKGNGDFAIYDDSYYSDAKYFNLDKAWGEAQTARLYFTVTFYNDGEVYGNVYIIKENETIVAPSNPTKQSTAKYDYEFIGWDQDFSTITRNMKIKAVYKNLIRSYEITYLDENGHEVEVVTLEYGSSVNQNVKAPEKKGNAFVSYEFLRWGEDGQTVTGEMSVSAVYQVKLTKLSVGLIAIVLFVLFILIVVFVKKKSRV